MFDHNTLQYSPYPCHGECKTSVLSIDVFAEGAQVGPRSRKRTAAWLEFELRSFD